MRETTEKAYAVLFQYSPNGRNDKGEFSASVADGRFYATREEACASVRAKFEEIFEKEKRAGADEDEEWALQLTEDDLKSAGYSWEKDFSRLGFEYESKFDDVPSEPKYSWTVVEMTRPAAVQ